MFLTITTAFASETPDYLKDGTITVTLENGKQYTFSANGYMVAKRGSKKIEVKPELAEVKSEMAEQKTPKASNSEPKRLKHIVSGEVLRSNSGLETSIGANEVNVKSKKDLGLGLQYQYNFHGDLYLGGRVDTNGGAGVSLGVGF